jgi:Sulfotransferase family
VEVVGGEFRRRDADKVDRPMAAEAQQAAAMPIRGDRGGMPANFNYLGLVALMLPGARIIYCARDPRDIGLSIFTFRFYGHHPYAHDLADLGWYIAQHERLMAHWRAVLPNPLMTAARGLGRGFYRHPPPRSRFSRPAV